MEQLVWAIIIIIFIIFTALKNRRARNKPETEDKTEAKRDKLASYMEELLGIEIPETKPDIKAEEERCKLPEEAQPEPDPIIENKIGQFESPLTMKYEEKWKAPLPAKKEIYSSKPPWNTLSGKDLKNAVIFAEILGPPVSGRKSHRLF